MRSLCRDQVSIIWGYYKAGYGTSKELVTVAESITRAASMTAISVDRVVVGTSVANVANYTCILPGTTFQPPAGLIPAGALGPIHIFGIKWRGREYAIIENFDQRRVGRSFLELKVKASIL